MIVVGFVSFCAFAVWEKFYSHTQFIRYELFKNRTVVGACALAGTVFFSFYCWDYYYINFCIVYYHLSVGMAGYMGQIYNTGSCFWSAVVGLVICYTRRFKNICLFFGVPVIILGTGLMIHFCGGGDNSNVGYLVMCQIFIAFAGGTLIIGQDVAVMVSSDREGVPMMLSMISLFSNLGGAIGYAVSAAIYANTFSGVLYNALPEQARSDYMTIYKGGYVTQITYPLGSEVRLAIDKAWSVYMKYDCIAATAVLGLAIPATLLWRDYNLDRKQNKGVVL